MNGRRFSRRANPQDTNGSIVICKVKGRDSKIRDMGNGEVQNIRGVGYKAQDIRDAGYTRRGICKARDIEGFWERTPPYRNSQGGSHGKGHLTTVPSYIARASERVCRHDVLCPSGNAAENRGVPILPPVRVWKPVGKRKRLQESGRAARQRTHRPVFCSCLGMI